MKGASGALLWVSEDPEASRELLEGVAGEFALEARFCGPGEILELIRNVRVDLIGLELAEDARAGLLLLRELHERLPRVALFAAAADSSGVLIRAALEAGAADFLSLPLGRGELQKALIKFAQAGPKNAAGRGVAGDVIAIYGARGGLGATTLAVNTAVRLAAVAASEVALVDLDLQRGDVAAFLNIAPLQSMATLAESRGEVDDIFLHGTLTRHGTNVFVLPAPQRMEEADTVAHDDVEVALRLLRAQFRFTVVDTTRTIGGPVIAAFEHSDRILVMTDRSVPGVRAAQRAIELLDRLDTPPERIALVVTEAVDGSLDVKDVVRTIGREPLVVIPQDADAASRAMNSGTPLNGRPGGLANAIETLVGKLSGIETTSRPKSGHLLRRIFAREARP